ncbi:transglycosylase family protein [Streptomyces abyssomicinicus]|uniref:LysM peptidoglycan-binding domain-containing protein n=1 Tax=Streptomyces abyssomicinicus TaxID=574929 RepID=UPI0012509158|nr:transglycosylase family protein [Streptomyces abyssomicinicus]
MLSGNGRHRRPRQAPAVVVAAGVTGSALALPLFAATGASAAEGATWDRVAECESGGAWSSDTGNGFYGGLQLSQEQWEENGGLSYASNPAEASRSQQIAVAERILAEQGATPWLACGAMNGLREDGPAARVDTGVDALRTGDVTGPGAYDGSASGWGVGGDRAGSGNAGGEADGTAGTGNADKKDKSGDSGERDGSGDRADRSSGHDLFPGSEYAPEGDGGIADLGLDLGLVDTGTGTPVIPDLPELGGGSGDQGGHGGDKATEDDKATEGGKDKGDSDGKGGAGSADEEDPLFGGDGSLFGDDTPLFGSGSGAQEESTDADSGSGRHRGASAEESGEESEGGSSGRHAAVAETYTVRAGDSLVSIARSEGVKGGWRALYEANEDLIGKNPDRLAPGTTLTLPVG